jgi:CobQ-like glutamine amidotransferase family enzyme
MMRGQSSDSPSVIPNSIGNPVKKDSLSNWIPGQARDDAGDRGGQKLHLVHLYPKEMNIYGDTGNRLILEKRLQWRGIEVEVYLVGVGDKLPDDADIIIGGGGQDAGQSLVEQDLATKANTIRQLVDNGVVMLMVCGLYQLFGRRFITITGAEIKGIGVLPLETRAGNTRLIGNTLYQTPWGEVVGYENHSGLTHLDQGAEPLGHVLKGAGNNGQDQTEGCLYKNVFATYSHGPILSKNPAFADELLRRALIRKYGEATSLTPLDDTLEQIAAHNAQQRPR